MGARCEVIFPGKGTTTINFDLLRPIPPGRDLARLGALYGCQRRCQVPTGRNSDEDQQLTPLTTATVHTPTTTQTTAAATPAAQEGGRGEN